MIGYITKRIGHGILVLWGVTTFIFFLIRLSGDPVDLMLADDATEQDRQRIQASLGLDQPLHIQYVQFIVRAAQGDFGRSFRHDAPSLQLVLDRLPATLELTAVAVLLVLVVSIPVGIISATRRGTTFDNVARFIAVVGQCTPIFWLGILLIQFFSVFLGVLPSFGRGTFWHVLLPGLTLAAYSVPITMRMLRSNLLDALSTDYVRTAHAKGQHPTVVLVKHALRNAAIPVLTVFTLRIGTIISGAVVTEQVFGYPGMGRLALQAIANRDYAVVQAFVALVAAIIVALNLLLDIAYGLLDPRVRVS